MKCDVSPSVTFVWMRDFYCIHFEKMFGNPANISVVQCCRIRIDHNEDHSAAIITEWLNHTRDDYNDVDFLVDESEIGAVWFFL